MRGIDAAVRVGACSSECLGTDSRAATPFEEVQVKTFVGLRDVLDIQASPAAIRPRHNTRYPFRSATLEFFFADFEMQ